MNYLVKLAFLMLFSVSIFLSGCKDIAEKNKPPILAKHIITAQLQRIVTPLFFSGTLEPIAIDSVTSPVDGRIVRIDFSYGQVVKKGQNLIALTSTTLLDDFRKSVSDYLQKKDAYDNGKESFRGNEALYKAKIISREEYLNARSQYENTILSFYQSRFGLRKVLREAGISFEEIAKLNLTDTTQVIALLRRTFDNVIVTSPAVGVALFPVATSGEGTSATKNKLAVGVDVKKGQLLLTIGDLSGFSAKIQVSEIDINQVKPGMKVIVTGDAFPQFILHGVVDQVAFQANPQNSGGGGSSLSMFSVSIKIPNITTEQQQLIHVGMTAKIELDIKHKTQRIVLPINAVFQQNGQSMVTRVESSGVYTNVIVQTGTTTPTGIVILNGVMPGDRIAVHD